MPHEQLDNLVKIGQLKAEPPSEQEVAGLIKSGRARLKDSKIESLSIESRFDLAYNAAHALSLAALRRAGYRSESRYIVFQCLKHTLNLANEQWRVLDQAHRKRNLAEYEGELDIDQGLLDSLIRIAESIADRIKTGQ
ncbi:MAG: hypothetical protein OEU36_01700 [Gammaproteobacteria bacterium]|nr:hypothetical protein [Gammaproteobacteria bacterium]